MWLCEPDVVEVGRFAHTLVESPGWALSRPKTGVTALTFRLQSPVKGLC